MTVSPSQGPQGTFYFSLEYISENGTGTGEIGIHVKTVDEVPVLKTFLNLAKEPGKTILLIT